MKNSEPIRALKELVDSVRVGLLCTMAADGTPRSRWMTATMLSGEPEFLYSLTISGSRKLDDIRANPRVSWSFQDPSLHVVANVSGTCTIIENPQLKARILETLGNALERFWHAHPEPGSLVIIETEIQDISVVEAGL